jgi:hypothetical protein
MHDARGAFDVTASERHRALVAGLVIGLAVLVVVVVVAELLRQRAKPAPEPAEPLAAAPAARHSDRTLDVFRSVPRDTIPIAWATWNAAPFAAARGAGKPVAILVDVAWSESCVLYAGALAADRAARQALERVIAVRVDADRRPDIFERYCASTLPAWVLLASDGGLVEVADAPLLPGLARKLEALAREASPPSGTHGGDPGVEVLRSQVPVPPPANDLPAAAAAVWQALQNEWPAPDIVLEPHHDFFEGHMLELLSVRRRDGDAAAQAAYREALERVAAHVDSLGAIDQEILPQPGRIHRGRFLSTQALWLVHWQRAAAAGDVTAVEIAAAARLRAWLDATLWDAERGLYRSAQGTLVFHAGKPALNSEEQARMRGSGHGLPVVPHVVDVYPAAGNARAAIALLETSAAAPDAALQRARGRRIVEQLRAAWQDEGRVAHDFTAAASNELVSGSCEWMGDVVELGRAMLAAAAVAPSPSDRARWLSDAEALAKLLTERFTDAASGLFVDIPPPVSPGEPARLQVRLAPLVEGGRAALFLCELAEATRNPTWREPARRAMSGWTRAVRGHDAWQGAPFAAAAHVLAEEP